MCFSSECWASRPGGSAVRLVSDNITEYVCMSVCRDASTVREDPEDSSVLYWRVDAFHMEETGRTFSTVDTTGSECARCVCLELQPCGALPFTVCAVGSLFALFGRAVVICVLIVFPVAGCVYSVHSSPGFCPYLASD